MRTRLALAVLAAITLAIGVGFMACGSDSNGPTNSSTLSATQPGGGSGSNGGQNTVDPTPTPNPCVSLQWRVREKNCDATTCIVGYWLQWDPTSLPENGTIDDGGVCSSWMHNFTVGRSNGEDPAAGDQATTTYVRAGCAASVTASLSVGDCHKSPTFTFPG